MKKVWKARSYAFPPHYTPAIIKSIVKSFSAPFSGRPERISSLKKCWNQDRT